MGFFPDEKKATDALLKLRQDDQWNVREAVAYSLRSHCLKNIEPLIQFGEKENSQRIRLAIAEGLRLITKQDHGLNFGKWKIFFDESLLRESKARPVELFDLATDPFEIKNRLNDPELKLLVKKLTSTALTHRTSGGHRFIPFIPKKMMKIHINHFLADILVPHLR